MMLKSLKSILELSRRIGTENEVWSPSTVLGACATPCPAQGTVVYIFFVFDSAYVKFLVENTFNLLGGLPPSLIGLAF